MSRKRQLRKWPSVSVVSHVPSLPLAGRAARPPGWIHQARNHLILCQVSPWTTIVLSNIQRHVQLFLGGPGDSQDSVHPLWESSQPLVEDGVVLGSFHSSLHWLEVVGKHPTFQLTGKASLLLASFTPLLRGTLCILGGVSFPPLSPVSSLNSTAVPWDSLPRCPGATGEFVSQLQSMAPSSLGGFDWAGFSPRCASSSLFLPWDVAAVQPS